MQKEEEDCEGEGKYGRGRGDGISRGRQWGEWEGREWGEGCGTGEYGAGVLGEWEVAADSESGGELAAECAVCLMRNGNGMICVCMVLDSSLMFGVWEVGFRVYTYER